MTGYDVRRVGSAGTDGDRPPKPLVIIVSDTYSLNDWVLVSSPGSRVYELQIISF